MKIIEFLIGASGISAIIIFLTKYIIDYLGKIGIDTYKSELQKEELSLKHKLEIETEKYRSELNKLSLEFQIKMSKLHIDQFEMSRNLYAKLIIAERPLEQLMRPVKFNPSKTEEEWADEVIKSANDFFNYFDENEILLKEEITILIKQIKQCYYEVWSSFSKKQLFGKDLPHELKMDLYDKMNETYNSILQGKMQLLKNELRGEFRKQIGIE